MTKTQFSCSDVSVSLQPHELQHARPPCPSPTLGSSLKLMSIKSVMPSSDLILGRPLLLLPSIPPSIRVFSNESTLHRENANQNHNVILSLTYQNDYYQKGNKQKVLRRDWGQEEKGTTEDEIAGWHHRLDGCESEWTPGAGDGQGGLACCDSWGRTESDTTERLNWLNWTKWLSKH